MLASDGAKTELRQIFPSNKKECFLHNQIGKKIPRLIRDTGRCAYSIRLRPQGIAGVADNVRKDWETV